MDFINFVNGNATVIRDIIFNRIIDKKKYLITKQNVNIAFELRKKAVPVFAHLIVISGIKK